MPEKKLLHETNEYEDPTFPLGIYTVTKSGIYPAGRGFFDLHWHEELQITFVTKGSVKMQVNTKEYALEKGDAIIINRNLLHITTEITEDGEYISLDFPEKMLGFFPGSRMEQDFVLPYTNDYAFEAVLLNGEWNWQKEIVEKIQEVLAYFREGKQLSSTYLIAMRLTEIWFLLVKQLQEEKVVRKKSYVRKQERIQSMLHFIHENYMQDILLEDIAARGNVSVGECCRCFRQFVRKSPNQYLLECRLQKAAEMLKNTDIHITEVAYEVGFRDVSYFVAFFKKKMGMTPKEYRSC